MENKIISTMLAGILIFTLLLPASISQTTDDDTYLWEDSFDTSYNIDTIHSENIEVSNGSVKIINTNSCWTDITWSRMKEISITNSGEPGVNSPIPLDIQKDNDMNADYSDLRFKHPQNPGAYLNYWIETYDSTRATVWVNIPTLPTGTSTIYLFYGNPTATSQSNYDSVFNQWEEQWANDEQLSYHSSSEGAWDSDVAAGTNNYLIAWEEGQAYFPPYTWQYKQEIRASIYRADGTREAFDFAIFTETNAPYRNENPSVCYGNNVYLVAYEHYINPSVSSSQFLYRDIQATYVSTEGNILNTITVASAATSTIAADPQTAFDPLNNRFAIVWEDARSSTTNYNIYAKLYDTNGNQIGSEKEICTNSNSQSEPWIAYDSNTQHYLIAWEEGDTPDNGPFSIHAGIYDENLNLLWTGLIAEGSASTDCCFPTTAISSQSSRYLISWNTCDISDEDYTGNVQAILLDSSGNTIKPTFTIKSGNYERSDITPFLSDSFFVAYDGGNTVWGRLLNSDGDVSTTELQLSASTAARADWCNIANLNGKLCITWEDTRVAYSPPWDDMPDTYLNLWQQSSPNTQDISILLHDEKQLVLEATATSIILEPDNLYTWLAFYADYTGTISFDILNEDASSLLLSDLSNAQDISGINPEEHPSIRLQAHLSREDPTTTPHLERWAISYQGSDTTAPLTTIDYIDGIQGQNNYYISQAVTIYLHAEDLPADTGIGINQTYYTIDHGTTQIYNDNTGIHLTATQQNDYMGDWDVTFWSEDRAGNMEDDSKPENTINVKIDCELPYVIITEPANEAQVNLPFTVRADATDNCEVDRVEFDIEPFGQRPGLPYVDSTPPYEWSCDIEPQKGTNLMIRAQVYDSSGQSWIDEHWIYINNMGGESFDNTFCLLFVTGTPQQQSFESTCIRDISWSFDNGFVLSTGLGGSYSITGAHSGNADNFIGVYNDGLIAGFATRVHVEQ